MTRLGKRKHPWRISNGTEYAHFSNYGLAHETMLDRKWETIELLDIRGEFWNSVADVAA